MPAKARQVRRAGKAAHIWPDFGQNDFRQAPFHAGDGLQTLEKLFVGVKSLSNLATQPVNGIPKFTEMLQVFSYQEAMVLLELASPRIAQREVASSEPA
jgi:hypothetical protein